MKKKNIFVFYGGESVERDISVITALQAMDNMDFTKYNVYPIYIFEDRFYFMGNYSDIKQYISFEKSLHKEIAILKDTAFIVKNNKLKNFCRKIDCALLCNHGGIYEGGSLQGFLELNNVPYTSCSVFASALCQSKRRLKCFLSGSNISTLPSFYISEPDDLNELLKDLNFSKGGYIVKPDSLGSSIGISVAHDEAQMKRGVELALTYDNEVIIEKYLSEVREFNCAVLKTQNGYIAGDVEEVFSNKSYLTFEEKYLNNGKYTGKAGKPIASKAPFVGNIKELALETAKLISSSGVIRCDFLVDKDEKIYLNEVNSIPGSLAYYLFDFEFKELIDMLIENAIIDFNLKNCKLKCFTTSYLDKNLKTMK